MTRVVNLKLEDFDAYIGRAGRGWGGYFGNPFRPSPHVDAIEQFRAYFLERVAKDTEFRCSVLALRGKRLGCFCKPARCHGDVIAEWIDAQPRDS